MKKDTPIPLPPKTISAWENFKKEHPLGFVPFEPGESQVPYLENRLWYAFYEGINSMKEQSQQTAEGEEELKLADKLKKSWQHGYRQGAKDTEEDNEISARIAYKDEEIESLKSEIERLKSSNPSIKRPTEEQITTEIRSIKAHNGFDDPYYDAGFKDAINWFLSIQPDKL